MRMFYVNKPTPAVLQPLRPSFSYASTVVGLLILAPFMRGLLEFINRPFSYNLLFMIDAPGRVP
jgi:hypothetical protein